MQQVGICIFRTGLLEVGIYDQKSMSCILEGAKLELRHLEWKEAIPGNHRGKWQPISSFIFGLEENIISLV